MRVPDDLCSPDHLLQLVDPAVEKSDLFLRLLVLGVVLDVARLEGFLEALARLGATARRNLEISLELLETLGRQQNRFGEIHTQALNRIIARRMDPSDLRAGLAERLANSTPIDAETFNAVCFMLTRELDSLGFSVPEAAPWSDACSGWPGEW